MALQPPTPLLRVVNNSKSPIRTDVVVPVGDTLDVSEYVADQLGSAGMTRVVEHVAEEPSVGEAKPSRRKAAPKK